MMMKLKERNENKTERAEINLHCHYSIARHETCLRRNRNNCVKKQKQVVRFLFAVRSVEIIAEASYLTKQALGLVLVAIRNLKGTFYLRLIIASFTIIFDFLVEIQNKPISWQCHHEFFSWCPFCCPLAVRRGLHSLGTDWN